MKIKMFVTCVAGLAFGLGITSAIATSGAESVPATIYLFDVGRQMNIKFTVEEDHGNGFQQSPLDTTLIPETNQHLTIDELVVVLRKALPKDDIFRDTEFKDVIHIVDTSLRFERDYPFDQIIPNFEYDGKLGVLPDDLGKQLGSSIGSPKMYDVHDLMRVDFMRTAALKVSGESVRSILTMASIKGSTGGILWQSQTSDIKAHAFSSVFFISPMPRVKAKP